MKIVVGFGRVLYGLVRWFVCKSSHNSILISLLDSKICTIAKASILNLINAKCLACKQLASNQNGLVSIHTAA
jgi:hypothetical protein